jgi:hypothetical protein
VSAHPVSFKTRFWGRFKDDSFIEPTQKGCGSLWEANVTQPAIDMQGIDIVFDRSSHNNGLFSLSAQSCDPEKLNKFHQLPGVSSGET